MISIDTNLLLFAEQTHSPYHSKALSFIHSLADDSSVVLSEFVLVEFYRLLRNPTVLKRPYSAADAVNIIQVYRSHSRWKIVGFPEGNSARLHDHLWRLASADPFAYRRIYDSRLALTLLQLGVKEFATANVKDFEGLGFQRVWSPL